MSAVASVPVRSIGAVLPGGGATDGPATAGVWITALGRPVHVAVLGGGQALIDQALTRLEYLDRLWNPGRSRSDLARLRHRAGVVVPVAPETVLLVALAARASLELAVPPWAEGESTRDRGTAGWQDAVADPRHGLAGVSGTAADLTGLARGLAADIVVGALLDSGAAGVMVSVGSCVRVGGGVPDCRGWVVPPRAGLPTGAVLYEGAAAWPDVPSSGSGAASVAGRRPNGRSWPACAGQAWRACALVAAAQDAAVPGAAVPGTAVCGTAVPGTAVPGTAVPSAAVPGGAVSDTAG